MLIFCVGNHENEKWLVLLDKVVILSAQSADGSSPAHIPPFSCYTQTSLPTHGRSQQRTSDRQTSDRTTKLVVLKYHSLVAKSHVGVLELRKQIHDIISRLTKTNIACNNRSNSHAVSLELFHFDLGLL